MVITRWISQGPQGMEEMIHSEGMVKKSLVKELHSVDRQG